MPTPLLTDLYELTMAASYLRRGMNDEATFSLFIRSLPPGRGFLVMAGLEDCLRFLAEYRFDEEQLAYLESLGFDSGALDHFRNLTFTGDVWAVPEGHIVFGGEPLLEVTAPLAQGQVIETFLLNQITFQSNIASKCARCRIAAGDRRLVDFGLRRTQGIEAGMALARASAVVGFSATSNVEAARRFGLRATGTMAHAYIQAFPSEAEAFRAYAEDFPNHVTFLVDTYDTLHGVRTAIEIIKTLPHPEEASIRLDSGDLLTLSREARHMLDEAGLSGTGVFATSGLDEFSIEHLVRADAPIDGFGVGTKIGVAADAPYLESVYKLVEYAGRPVIKTSTGKVTAPGRKQIFRPDDMRGDLVGLRDESIPEGYTPLLQTVMRGGMRTGPPSAIADARERFEADLARLPAVARDLREPQEPKARHTPRLYALQEETRAWALEMASH